MYQLWTTMQARNIQPSDVAWRWTRIGDRQQGPTCKQTRWLLIVSYDITSAGVGQRKTSGNRKWRMKFLSRPIRKVHWGRLGFGPVSVQLITAKHETQARRGEFVIIRPGSPPDLYFWCWSQWFRYVQWRNMLSSLVCFDNLSCMITVGG